MYFSTKKAERIYMTAESSLYLPVQTLAATKESMPSTIPSEMLAVKGIISIVTKQGIDSVKSTKSICTMERSIITPTRNRALVVAAAGIMRNTGEKKSAARKSAAAVNEVSPVRPPSKIPVVLST